LGIFEINDAARLVQEAVHPEANIIFGAVIDDTLGDEVRVTVIAAGFDGGEPSSRPVHTEKRSNFVEAPVPVAVAAAAEGDEPSPSEGWAREPEVPVVASLDDFDDDGDLDIPDFLK
ncbi:cell division protein FtsZ, partial [Schumannella luteola]